MSLSIHFYAIHSICSWTNIRKSNTHTSNTIINSFFFLIRSLSSAFAHFLPHLFFFKSSAYAQYPLHINKNMHALECNRVIYQCVQNWAWALFDKEKKLQFSFSLIFSLALSLNFWYRSFGLFVHHQNCDVKFLFQKKKRILSQ